VAYIQLEIAGGETAFGVGIDRDIAVASFRAILAALNRQARSSGGRTRLNER
jgi:hypothetical protein